MCVSYEPLATIVVFLFCIGLDASSRTQHHVVFLGFLRLEVQGFLGLLACGFDKVQKMLAIVSSNGSSVWLFLVFLGDVSRRCSMGCLCSLHLLKLLPWLCDFCATLLSSLSFYSAVSNLQLLPSCLVFILNIVSSMSRSCVWVFSCLPYLRVAF